MQNGDRSFWKVVRCWLHFLAVAVVSLTLPYLMHYLKTGSFVPEPGRILAIIVPILVLAFCYRQRRSITRDKALREMKGGGVDRFKYYAWITLVIGLLLLMVGPG